MEKSGLFKRVIISDLKISKTWTVAILLAAFVAFKIFFSLFLPNQHVLLASDLTADNILKAINQQRALRNIVVLNTNDKLTLAAQAKSNDMQARHYFSHVDPDGNYIWDTIVADGYTPYAELGENLAIEFYNTDSLISAWMNSPEHRSNILQEGFRDQGMGLAFGDVQQNQYYSAVTNTFGTLAASPQTTPAQTVAKTAPAPTIPAASRPAAPKTVAPQAPAGSSPKFPSPAAPPDNSNLTQAPTTALANQSAGQTAFAQAAQTTLQPVEPRGTGVLAQNPNSNFTLTEKIPAASAAQTSISKPAAMPSASGVIGVKNNSALIEYQINRYLLLICGAGLLLLLLSDLKSAIEKKLGSLDKKVNNLVLLVMSLIVIAFIYWL